MVAQPRRLAGSFVPWLLAAALAGLATFLVFETWRLAELAGTFEVQARQANERARVERQDGEAALAALVQERDALCSDVARLAQEVLNAKQQQAALADAVRERIAIEEQQAEAAAAARAARLVPMPEGVRLCLSGLHDCLRAEGYVEQRFVSARSLDDAGLHQVEFLDVAADGLATTVVYADLMTATLDRASGRLELRFFKGHRTAAGERQELPEDGWPMVFAPIDGRLFEQRLPFLVRAHGAYAEEVGKTQDPDLVDPATRASWLERFDRLCDLATSERKLRVQRFRGMRDGYFLDAQLVGTNEHHHVVLYGSAARLSVEVDDAAGVVSLVLSDGGLRSNGIDSKISAEGYRMLLSNVTPAQAIETMLGMVVRR